MRGQQVLPGQEGDADHQIASGVGGRGGPCVDLAVGDANILKTDDVETAVRQTSLSLSGWWNDMSAEPGHLPPRM